MLSSRVGTTRTASAIAYRPVLILLPQQYTHCSELNKQLVAPPTVTSLTVRRFKKSLPSIVIEFPPTVGPSSGVILVTAKALDR